MRESREADQGPRFDSGFRRNRKRPINCCLVGLLISSLISGLSAVVYVDFKDTQRRVETTRHEAETLAASASRNLDAALGKLEEDLNLLAGLPDFGMPPSLDPRSPSTTAGALAQRGRYRVAVMDLNQRVMADTGTSKKTEGPKLYPDDLVTASQDGKLLFTQHIEPDRSGSRDQLPLALILPIKADDARPQALVAQPSQEWLNANLAGNDIPPGWRLSVVDASGIELARRPGGGSTIEDAGNDASFVHRLRLVDWRVKADLPATEIQLPLSRTPAIPALIGATSILFGFFCATRMALTARAARIAKNASETRLRMAMKMESMAAFTLDRDLRFTWFHSSHPDLGHMMVGQNETALFSPETAGVLSAMHHQVLNTGMEIRRDVMVQIKSKLKRRYFDLMLRPLFNDHGETSGVIGIAVDITDRMCTEKQLRESQEDLKLAQSVARTGSWRLNIWSNELVWSDEAWRIFGIPRSEKLTYARYMDAVHPDDREHVAERWIEALHGSPYDVDHRIVVGNEIRWVRQRATLEYDDQGVLVGGFGTAQDITGRKRLEDEIRQREQYLRAVLDNMPFMLWLKDDQSRFLAVNKNFARTFGATSVESLTGKDDFDVAPTDLALNYRKDDAEVLRTGCSKNTEELIYTGNKYRWFETYKSPVIVDGNVIGTVGYARDISQRRLMEERLRESEAFNLAVLNSLSEHIAVLDEHGVIVAVNKAWKQFAEENGAPELAENSVGLSYRDASISALGQRPDLERENAWHGIIRVIRGVQSRFTCEYTCPSGTEQRYFRMSVYPLPAPRRGAVVSHEEITARKRAEAAMRQATFKAEQANNAKSRFLAAASHDLRQPLSALALYVGMLGSRLTTEDAVLMRNMKDCLSSLNELLSNLLDLSMLEAGVTTPEIRDFPLAEMFSKAVSIHAPEANMKGLLLHCADTSLAARTDPVLFGRMLRNLVSNAVRYTEHGGVLVGCRRRGGKLWVEVWDTGIGIPADKTQEIFEEFKQLHNDERNRGKGSGLGLAIVAKTAALLGLEIRVKSEPGRGSMFAVEIPLGKATETVTMPQGEYRALWIGLVENDPAVLEALTRSLESVGHHVVDASSGDELMELLDGIPPDIVISDYRLDNGESGFSVINRLRSSFDRDVPALIITGDTDSVLMRHMATQGIRVLHKPLELEALQDHIVELTTAAAATVEIAA